MNAADVFSPDLVGTCPNCEDLGAAPPTLSQEFSMASLTWDYTVTWPCGFQVLASITEEATHDLSARVLWMLAVDTIATEVRLKREAITAKYEAALAEQERIEQEPEPEPEPEPVVPDIAGMLTGWRWFKLELPGWSFQREPTNMDYGSGGYDWSSIDRTEMLDRVDLLSLHYYIDWKTGGLPVTAECQAQPSSRSRSRAGYCSGREGLIKPSPRHIAPMEGCTCGIYAINDKEELLSRTSIARWSGYTYALAEIEQWGKVVQAENGRKSEHARIKKLFIPRTERDHESDDRRRDHERLMWAFATKFNCEVEAHDLDVPPPHPVAESFAKGLVQMIAPSQSMKPVYQKTSFSAHAAKSSIAELGRRLSQVGFDVADTARSVATVVEVYGKTPAGAIVRAERATKLPVGGELYVKGKRVGDFLNLDGSRTDPKRLSQLLASQRIDHSIAMDIKSPTIRLDLS